MHTGAVRELLHRGAKFDFERVTLQGRDGSTLRREVVRHPGAVVILGLRGDGCVAMIRNRRVAIEATIWELPAGTLEPGEDPAACAGREFAEEAGWEAGRIEPIGAFYTTPGMTDERMHAFLATELREVGQRLEPDESIETHFIPLGEAFALIDQGELIDAKSMLALLLARRKGMLPTSPAEAAP